MDSPRVQVGAGLHPSVVENYLQQSNRPLSLVVNDFKLAALQQFYYTVVENKLKLFLTFSQHTEISHVGSVLQQSRTSLAGKLLGVFTLVLH